MESKEKPGTVIRIELPNRRLEDAVLRDEIVQYGAPGMASVLTGMADVLRPEAYSHLYMD